MYLLAVLHVPDADRIAVNRMSDAGDEIQVDAPAAEVEVSTDAPKGKLSVEDALQVCFLSYYRSYKLLKLHPAYSKS